MNLELRTHQVILLKYEMTLPNLHLLFLSCHLASLSI
jgi:hypothetical protein